MRHALAVIAAVVVLSGTVEVFGQQTGETRGSVSFGDLSFAWTESHGFETYDGAAEVSLMRFFNPRFSTELSVGYERHRSYVTYYQYGPDGRPIGVFHQSHGFNSWPVDAVAQYHFLNDSRWIPYVGLGARYANGPNGDHEVGPEIAGGVFFRMTPNLALRFDARQLIGNGSATWNHEFKPFIGLSWKFGGRSSSSAKPH